MKMAHKSTFETKFKRRKNGKTDFKRRLELLKSKKPRLVVRGSNKRYSAQVVKYNPKGDETIASAVSTELKEYGWSSGFANIPAAYLTGFLCGKKALVKGVKEAILDIGLVENIKGNRCFAALKGAIDAGLKMPADEKAFPSAERVKGMHIAEFAKKIGEENARKKFSAYFKNNSQPEKIPEYFEKTKQAIGEKLKS
ncbi:MAG: large subunit ribosomal protein L18 [archaeon GW2011_AR21]|nr:50S ribosomal protein L18P [uncultured archaeon]KHO55772.1 MAG: large subunit ribosomal protein L18 [archaeon GW2011_AR21]